ncbi:polysaccharide deacetylase family protein [Paenibacillus elgii]|uniref:polysaccharide deacetylase family protein n=1 Tax=Paenibacillus elgii TaxID=189691 RepID=UPI000248C231|nr:polysaccharide deacetylase family protein [Paenibacillus elgii]
MRRLIPGVAFLLLLLTGVTLTGHTLQSEVAGGQPQPALTHPTYLTQRNRTESAEEYRRRIRSDLTFMNERLRSELGNHSRLLAFPYGAYNEETLQAAEEAGIGLLFTIKEGINSAADRLVYRINAGEPYMTADALIATISKYH